MILRSWRTGIDESRADEYDAFAHTVSTPMFHQQRGFRGLLLARSENLRVVFTLWQDADSAEALNSSETYRRTVAAIQEAGFLRPPQSVELLTVPDEAVELWWGRASSVPDPAPESSSAPGTRALL